MNFFFKISQFSATQSKTTEDHPLRQVALNNWFNTLHLLPPPKKKLSASEFQSSRKKSKSCNLAYEMDALKAVGLKPLPILAKQIEPKKNLPFSTVSLFKNQSLSNSSTSSCGFYALRTVSGGLVLLSSFLTSGLAEASTFDEALQQPFSSSSFSDFDVGGVVDSAIRFATENPIIAGGGAAVVAVPLVVAQLLGKAKPWGVESAKVAYAKLGDDANAQLLDIRPTAEIKQSGSPDIRGVKKKAVAVVYNGDDKPGFLKKLKLKLKEPENTTLFILDK